MIEGLIRSESGKIHVEGCEKVKRLQCPLPVPLGRAVEGYRWALCCHREIAKLVAQLTDPRSEE